MKQMPSFSPLLRTNLTYAAVLVAMVVAFVALGSLFRSNVRLYGTLLGLLGLIMLVLLRQYFVLQDNRRLYRELEQVAVTDALTGLSNRRSFDQALEREVARAQRYLRPLCLLLIDLDNFKLYNDKHGHLRGDELLREFAQLLRTNLRSSDMVARFGGDEFVVILPETDEKVSRAVVEKLGREVNAALASDDGVGISVGKAFFEPDMTASVLLDLADRNMYREKASSPGR
jgi:diguanylate cyclase (GGDEF)-like protein